MLFIYLRVSIALFNTQTENNVKKLFASSSNISDNTFSYSQIESLPEPVQRYFKIYSEGGKALC